MPTRSPLRHQVVHGHEPADLEGGKAEEQDDSPSEAARQYSIDERPQDRTCNSKQDDEFNPPGVRHGGILLHDRVRRGRAPPRAGPLTGDRDASACLGWPRSRSDVRDGRDSARESNAIATNRPSGARVGAADAGRERLPGRGQRRRLKRSTIGCHDRDRDRPAARWRHRQRAPGSATARGPGTSCDRRRRARGTATRRSTGPRPRPARPPGSRRRARQSRGGRASPDDRPGLRQN